MTSLMLKSGANRIALSVIIPMHNASATIRLCLDSIVQNIDSNYEIIVVDDASSDESLAIASEFPCKIISLSSRSMAANCRNIGAKHARGDYLFFFDADQMMKPDTISAFLNALEESPDCDAVVGSFSADTPAPGFFSRFKNFRHHYVHQQASRDGSTLASGMTIIRARIFLKHGGFEPAFQPSSIEDIALGYKLIENKSRIQFRPDLQLIHLKRYDLIALLVSDVRDRAVPWMQIILRNRIWKNDLNIKIGNVACVLLSWLAPLCLLFLGIPVAALTSITCLLSIWTLNFDLLQKGYRHFGLVFLLYSLMFIPFMYLSHGVGALVGILLYVAGASNLHNRTFDVPDYTILQDKEIVSKFEAAGASPAHRPVTEA